jgi:hypothetical protein
MLQILLNLIGNVLRIKLKRVPITLGKIGKLSKVGKYGKGEDYEKKQGIKKSIITHVSNKYVL